MKDGRLSVNMTVEHKQEVNRRAAAAGISITERVRKALNLLDTIEDQPEGTKVFLQRPADDQPVEVILL